MSDHKRRPALTKKQKEEYAKVPITKEDEAKLRDFLRKKPRLTEGQRKPKTY